MKTITREHWLESRPWIDSEAADIQSYAASVPHTEDYNLEEKLREWRERGIVVFEQAVDKRLIDALLSDVDYLRVNHQDYDLIAEIRGVQKPIAEFTRDELNSDGFKFNSIHSISRAAGHLSLTKSIMSFLQHIFLSEPHVLQSLTFYRGSQQPAHIDYPYVRCQTELAHLAASWVPLEDIHADAGPLVYYPGSHHLDISGFFDWGNGSIVYEPDSERTPSDFADYLEQRAEEAGIKPEAFLPRRGDVLIWHGNLIHKGSAINNQALTRKSYVTHYTSIKGFPAAHRRSDLKGLIANGGIAYDYPWLEDSRNCLPSHD